MDVRIEELKKEYLKTPIPMTVSEGFAEVMSKIENDTPRPSYYSRVVLFAVIVLLFTGGFFGVALASTPNSALYPVKEATIKTLNALHVPLMDVETKETKSNSPKKVEPSAKPTAIPKPTNKPSSTKPSQVPGKSISEEKRRNNPTVNDEKVKGANTRYKPTSIPAQQDSKNSPGNSEANRNDNSVKLQSNSHTSEKINNGRNK